MKKRPKPSMNEALFRYQLVSEVLNREHQGEVRSQAIAAVSENSAAARFNAGAAQPLKVSERTLYRWLAAFEKDGFDGLFRAERKPIEGAMVLEKSLLDFFKEQKLEDPFASTPELIRRAKALGLVAQGRNLHRVTVWRSLSRMGLDTERRKKPKQRDKLRFAYPHRLDMVLCDGKHFRAGSARLRRVALFFLDDATRAVLHVVVGTSESAFLFLRGLYETILHYGRMSSLYVDRGSGFIALDAIAVLASLEILFIHGTAGYPEGHGKIERFNQTAGNQILRHLDGNPSVDPSCGALELRLRHYLTEQYNQIPHEGIAQIAPWLKFESDPRPLRFFESREALRGKFILSEQRVVSKDNIIKGDGVNYEVPPGYAKQSIMVQRNVLDQAVSIIHEGRLIRLAPVDLHANAISKRTKPESGDAEPCRDPQIKSSAQIIFEQDLKPIVDPDGGFQQPKPKG